MDPINDCKRNVSFIDGRLLVTIDNSYLFYVNQSEKMMATLSLETTPLQLTDDLIKKEVKPF
jgi:hypothetical protein